MTEHEHIKAAFELWRQTYLVPEGISLEKLEKSRWYAEQAGRAPLLFAAPVALTEHNYDAAGDYFAQALKIDTGKASHWLGYGPVLLCFSAEELAAMTAAAPDAATLASQLTTALRAYGEELLKDEPLPSVTTTSRDMTDPYTAVSLFQTCLLALHQQLPHLSLLDLHHLCYFHDVMHVELYGVSLFGTPTRVATGVSYLQELPYSVHRLLQAVATHFAGATSKHIQEIVQQETAVKAAEMHGEVFYSCMRAKLLEASDTVKTLLATDVFAEDIPPLDTLSNDKWLSVSSTRIAHSVDTSAAEFHKQLKVAHELLAGLRTSAEEIPLLAEARQLLSSLQRQLDTLCSDRAKSFC